jgi:hypothetical protein
MEEKYPKFFGENGQYPLVIVRKSESGNQVKIFEART